VILHFYNLRCLIPTPTFSGPVFQSIRTVLIIAFSFRSILYILVRRLSIIGYLFFRIVFQSNNSPSHMAIDTLINLYFSVTITWVAFNWAYHSLPRRRLQTARLHGENMGRFDTWENWSQKYLLELLCSISNLSILVCLDNITSSTKAPLAPFSWI